MIKYFGVVQDQDGNAVAGATVTITNQISGAAAPIYADDETTPLSNPLTADAYGRYAFKAASGVYQMAAVFGAYSTSLTSVSLVEDPSIVYLVNDQGSAITVGQVVYVSGDGLVKLAESDNTEVEASAVAVCVEATLADGDEGRFRTLGLVARAGNEGEVVYLSATAGATTETAPTTGWSLVLGRQVSSTLYYLDPGLPVQL